MKRISIIYIIAFFVISCADEPKYPSKGFTVNNSSPEEGQAVNKTGIQPDSVVFNSRPNGVLLTAYPQHRLIPIYKLNIRVNDDDDTTYYTGRNSFYSGYSRYENIDGNNWNHNFMPGFEAMYGYNLININYYNSNTQKTTKFFKKPVLIKTLYYPTDSKDTLNGEAVLRDYYMVSAYNKDSNKDGYINTDDLRRFFLFDLDGAMNMQLIPDNYSVISSQFDPFNDHMYVYAAFDENKNGHQDETEQVHVFRIELKSPKKGVRLY
ncbi:MAG: hypothetical protein ACPGLV_00320 [Bacteroidia bacterium]